MYYYRLYRWFVVMMVALVGVACASEDGVDKSPLATWDPGSVDTFTDATVGNGTLNISPGCVLLVLDNQKTILLVWPEPTSWNESSQAIEFVGVRGEQMTLHNGDKIIPGGMTPIEQPQYVSSPDPSCQADETFIVNSLSLVTE